VIVKILLVAAEASPLVKVGGLADVVGSLPKALNKLGHDVRVMLPQYGIIDLAKYNLSPVISNFDVQIFHTKKPAALGMTDLYDELKIYLVGNKEFFGSKNVYGGNEAKRFFFFDRAAVEAMSKINWQPDIIHCHDWHTALIPMWLKKINWNGGLIFTIHNLAYQGSFDNLFLSASGLDQDWHKRPEDIPEPPLNFMSQGIIWADMITTVSENYAREVVNPECGMGLDTLLHYRRDKFVGIINGIDYEEYNPSTDHFIAANFDSSSLGSRVINKLTLQKQLGLPEDIDTPVIGMVSRLDEQKGFDIVIDSIALLFEKTQAQLVIVGQGKEQYHSLLKKAAIKYPHRLAVSIGFNEALGHLVYAGCDMFLMPSCFEPCGLGQLIAMRYGAIPVVRHTGGLVDTVEDLSADLGNGNGFVFRGYNVKSMLDAVKRAVDTYKEKESWQRVMRRIMSLDFSWQNSARKYEAVYQNVLRLKNHAPK
jgi:starch synthase